MKFHEKLPGYILNFLLILFVAMPMVSRLTLKYPDNERYYPFWATDLFAGFLSTVELYSVKIFELNGKVYKNGIDSFELRRTTEGFGFSASTSIEMLGRSLEKQSSGGLAKAKALFEQNYLTHDKSCVYAVYKSSWSAVDRWRHGKINWERELVRFEYKK